MSVEKLNPAGLHANPAFSQAAVIDGGSRLILIGGQNGIGPDGSLAGADLSAQTERALDNIGVALAGAGAARSDLVQLSIYIVGDEEIGPAFAKWQGFWGGAPNPPLVKVLRVSGLANPAFKIEIEAVAAIAAT